MALINREYKEGVHYNREIERAVLGVCLLEKTPLPVVIRMLKPEVFYLDSHQLVFNALKDMFYAKLDIDLLTVCQYLWSKGVQHIASDNTAAFLTRLTRDVVSGAHARYHAVILQDLHLKRVAYGKGEVLAIKSAKWKFPPHARWYLSMVSKQALRLTATQYGKKMIRSKNAGTEIVRVPNTDWVYILHLARPEYTWTCLSSAPVYRELSREACAALIPVHKKLYVENGTDLVWR